ncbi:hypothetical protein EGM70_04665 [Enterobacteriaceae bacterium 89]|nr:hypothetical protein [Enterobacteriaceae bacterium 89]
MPSGLLIALNDGGPRMEITAGLRCPSFSGEWTSSNTSLTLTMNNYVAGSEVILLPKRSAGYSPPQPPNLIPTIGVLTGFTQSGANVTQTYWSSNGGTMVGGYPASVWQILPAGISGTSGFYIQDSTDFMAITTNTMVGYCVWRGAVTFKGSWSLPALSVPQSNLIVFGKWSAPGVTIECDGTAVTAYSDRNGDDDPATVTMTIAIFASGVAPQPGPGLNFFKNGQCMFSTTKRPFVYRRNTWTPSWSESDIGDNMIMLGVFGYDSSVANGWDYLKFAGLVRNGNSVRCGRGKVQYSWTSKYPLEGRRLTNIAVPSIPSMY